MMLRSRGVLRFAAALAAVGLISACDGSDRPKPLAQVQPIVIPVADTTTRTNFNIDDPTLEIPATFPVGDLDLLTLVWSDEFNGAQLDPEVWFFESGDGSQYGIPGWGNNERQWYLPDNAQLQDGKLKITARRETVGDFGYTSARINTRDRFAFKYGRIEASIKLPSGQGLWPAFWMLAQDSPYGGWPASGEIDILEAVNLDGFPGPGGIGGDNEIFGTLHYGGGSLGRIIASTTYVPSTDVTEGFHTYALEWDEFEIRWYYDGILYAIENSWRSSAAPYPAPFDQPFYILLNLAVGGNFPGSPDGSTPFPATMEVDWIRVYSGEESDPVVEPTDPGIVPAAGVYASDPDTMNEDLAPPGGIQNFGSGAAFVNDFSDPTFTRVLRVTSGDAYDPGNVEVGFAAFTGYSAGFATGYETLHFKVKGDTANLSAFEVKFFGAPGEPETSMTYNVTTYTDLGNGWYQVSIPTSDFSGSLATNTGFLLGPLGDQGTRFSFLMTDIGFDPPDGGGGGGGGDTVLATFDEAVPPAVNEFGGAGYAIEPGPAGGDGNALRITRDGGEVYAGVWVAIPPIPNDAGAQTVSALVYSPLAGIPMVVKAEYGDNQGTGDVAANEAVVVGWQTLTWTFTNLAPPNEYNRFTILPNLGTSDVPAQIYYFDNITLLESAGGGGGGGGGAGDLAVNGGFETGDLSGWALFPVSADPNEQTVVTTNPRAGTYAGRLNNTTPGTASIIKQANLTPVSIGQTATVRFSARGSFGVGGVAFAEFFTELAGEGTSSAQILGGGPLTLDADPSVWADFEFVVPISTDVSGGVTLQLTATTGGAGSFADVYYDNVSIVIN